MVDADMGEAWYGNPEPCRLCRNESMPISGNLKYCALCYKELLASAILGKWLES